MNWPEIFDRQLGNHHLHQGLSNGGLIVIWLAYILSEGDHCKSHVQEWVDQRRQTLEKLTGQTIRPEVEFNDDRLSIGLRRLSDPEAWAAIEAAVWSSSFVVYRFTTKQVRLDSTSSYGFHLPFEGGVMQFGYSKDQRPDLPQIKLMAAAAQPAGQIIACDVLPGQSADDRLYTPLIGRVREILGETGLLYAGDSKIAALETRAHLVAQNDFYLCPLPLNAAPDFAKWVRRATEGDQCASLIWEEDRLLGAGYEFMRPQSAIIEDKEIVWEERVLVVRSHALAQSQNEQLERRLSAAQTEIENLTPPPARGKRQFTDEMALHSAIEKTLKRHKVEGLLDVKYEREAKESTRYVGRGRPSTGCPTATTTKVRYQITGARRQEEAIARAKAEAAWRAMVTNAPVESLSLDEAVSTYRAGICLERDFHLLKDRPLGLSPLWVWRDDQIKGLTHLLTIGLRLLTLIETKARASLKEAQTTLAGLYEGNPNRSTDRPTARRLLKAFGRTAITRTQIEFPGEKSWCVTPLTPLLEQILALLGLSLTLYTQLGDNSS
jgi:transposase